VEELAAAEGVGHVTIADRNLEAARRIAGRLAGRPAKVDAVQLDAGDQPRLVQALRGYDVAASALGPFYLFETDLVRAAVEAGVDYASVCDEWEPAGAVIDQFDAPARQRGVTILTGLGTSPGLTNVGIRYFAQRLDVLQRADVYVYQPLDAGGGEAVIRHMLHVISGRVVAWRGGQRVMVPACSEELQVEFPQFGAITVWNMGHAEPETVPRFLPGVEEVNFYMGFGPGSGFFIRPARWGLLANRSLRHRLAQVVSLVERLSSGGEPSPGAVRVDVWGELRGQKVHQMACGIGQMREATGISLSIGALMLARGELLNGQGGVLAPEACLDPQVFLSRMSRAGIQAYTDLAMAEPIG
jgi:saccharopine dehydrogenase-like NADP-dependent oxidoreductase